MKKQLSAFFLSLVLILSGVSAVFAQDTPVCTDSNGIVYELSSDSSYLILTNGGSASGSCIIPETVELGGTNYTVKEIAAKAFYGSAVTSISLPATITHIGDMAFAYCSQLTKVSFGRSQVTLGNRIFAGSPNLSGVTNYSGFQKIGYGVFDGTEWLSAKSISTLNSAVYLGKVLVVYFGDASSFKINTTALSIAPDAFKGNTTLKSIDLSNITSVGSSAFEDCTELSSVTFGNALTEIGAYAFDGCTSLTGDIVFHASLEKLGASAFSGTSIETVDLSATAVTTIENGAFRHCDSLSKVTLAEGTRYIGNYAFQNDASLSEIIAQDVISIGYDAFRGCSLLASKNGFANVESILSGAFDGTAIYSDANGSEVIIGKTLYKIEANDILLSVADGVKSISPYAFYAAQTASLLALPASLESIGEDAFVSLTDGTIFVFSQNDNVYSDLASLPSGTVYIPKGKTIENENVSVGYMKSISITQMPDKTEYSASDNFDPAGMSIELNTVIDGVECAYDISEIGYSPSYTYNFASSPVVTVNYCGFEAEINVSLEASLSGDVDKNGSVNSDDILLLRKYIAGLVADEEIDTAASDIDGAAGINSDDLLLLRKVVAGLVNLD